MAWCRHRLREWARRPGASPPMRMTASWSGPLWTDRIQGCGAMIRARWQAPPLIVDGFRPTHLSRDLRTASDDGKRARIRANTTTVPPAHLKQVDSDLGR